MGGGLGGSSFRLPTLEPLGSLVRGVLGSPEDVDGVAALYAKRRHGVAIFPVAFEATHVAFEIFLCFDLSHGRRGRHMDFLRRLAGLADEYLE